MCVREGSEPDDVLVGRSDPEATTSGDGRNRQTSGQTAALRRARGSVQPTHDDSVRRRATRTCSKPRRCESDTSLNDVTQQHFDIL